MTDTSEPDDGFAFGGADVDWEAVAPKKTPQRGATVPASSSPTVSPSPTESNIPAVAAPVLPQTGLPTVPVSQQIPQLKPLPSTLQPAPVAPQVAQQPTYSPTTPAPIHAPVPVQVPTPAPVATPVPVQQPVQPLVQEPVHNVVPVQAPVQIPTHDAHAGRVNAGMEDLNTPDWANIRATTPTGQPGTRPEDDDMPVFMDTPTGYQNPGTSTSVDTVTPTIETHGARTRTKKRAPKPRTPKKPLTAKEKKQQEFAGGRWQIKALRYIILGLIAVLILVGLKTIIIGKKIPSTEQVASQVATNLGFTSFPTDAAQAFAIQFTDAYLTYDPDHIEQRQEQLAYYTPNAANGDWGSQNDGTQKVVAGPYVSGPAVQNDPEHATVRVSAEVTGNKWITLDIPVYASPTGGLVIAGPPSYVANPTLTKDPGVARPPTDQVLSQEVATTLLPGFLTAWAASDSSTLTRYVAPDAVQEALIGLNGEVTFKSLGETDIWDSTTPQGTTRWGVVTVTWDAGTAGTVTQEYAVQLEQDPTTSQWSVRDIQGGVFDDPSEASTGSLGSAANDGSGPIADPGNTNN